MSMKKENEQLRAENKRMRIYSGAHYRDYLPCAVQGPEAKFIYGQICLHPAVMFHATDERFGQVLDIEAKAILKVMKAIAWKERKKFRKNRGLE